MTCKNPLELPTPVFNDQDHGFENGKYYFDKKALTWSCSQNNVTPQQLFDLVTYGFDDLINTKKSYLHTKAPFNQNTSETKWEGLNDENSIVQEQRIKKRGKCWTISFPGNVTQLGIRKIKLYL